MTVRTVYLNGQFVPEAEARVSIYDSGLTLGDMAFEVTRTCRQRPFRLREHLERLFHGLSVLRIDPGMSLDEIEQLSREVLRRNRPTEAGDVDWNIIHNISRGPSSSFLAAFDRADRRPTVVISSFPLVTKLAALAPAYERGLDVVVPQQRALPGSLLDASLKTRSRLHYQLANLQAEETRPGATAVLMDPDGYLTEATSGNLFVVVDGKLLTPASRNVLPGVTRHIVCGLAEQLGIACHEADITPPQAARSDECFLTSTSIGILHVGWFEGHVIGGGAIGPVTERLRAALFDAMGVDIAAQARLYASQLAAL